LLVEELDIDELVGEPNVDDRVRALTATDEG
jgi:hypothetical protein